MSKILSLLIITFTLTQCGDKTNDSACTGTETYSLRNLSDLDGCTWSLVRGDQSYEAINLVEYISQPEDGQEVEMRIVERPDFLSICMVGKIVEIECMQ